MNLVTELTRLNDKQLKRLADVMLAASIKYELGLDWRIVFTKEKNSSIGRLSRMFACIESLTDEEFDSVSRILAEEEKE